MIGERLCNMHEISLCVFSFSLPREIIILKESCCFFCFTLFEAKKKSMSKKEESKYRFGWMLFDLNGEI
jgi:hypothetical protein